MEQWQFLIQKEGERTWYPLDKPRVEIVEGRYRVVARSNRNNTDVEVRVTHSSSNEVPPVRRIQKKRRRINSQGLTAVIPFTYLKSGMWELQCSGDLMSDIMGIPWQYSVICHVVPASAKLKKVGAQPNRNSPSSKELKTNDAGLISSISVESLPNKGSSRNTARKLIDAPPSSSKKSSKQVVSEKPAQKLRESLKAKADKQKAVSKKEVSKTAPQSTQKPLSVENKANSEKPLQKFPDSVKAIPDKAVSQKSHSYATKNKKVSKKPVEKQLEKPSQPKRAVSEKPAESESAIAPANSPVRVKGDTAEQILKNLIDLALPSSESILASSTTEDTPIAPPLPLLLTLNNINYTAQWGESITLEGLVELKETAEAQIKQIKRAEVLVELRSPQNSELLKSNTQPNPDKSLPFAIACSIDIPSGCESKLILGEVKVYGVVSSHGIVELLASQSFTVTADITELIAITVTNRASELELFGYSTDELSLPDNASQILEPTVSLDLELFDLAKTAKQQQSLPGVPSTKKSLPPRVETRRLHRGVSKNSPKLPSVPGYQEKIDEYINNAHIGSIAESTGTSFPFLRKLKALPTANSNSIELEESTYAAEVDNQNTSQQAITFGKASLNADNQNLAELVVDDSHSDDSFEFDEPITPRNSEFMVAENINSSPLIRKWMLSQGYSVPEPIDVEYEDYEIAASDPEISYQQVSLSPDQTDDKQTEYEDKPQDWTVNVSSNNNSSPYLSISTSSGWEIDRVIATPSTQIAQEIVVDDTDIFADNILTTKTSEDEPIDKPKENLSTAALTIGTHKIEQLPIPQMYLAKGELIAGKSVNVRVRLPAGNSHLAVKLWLEDCQTRNLLDGPHLINNLTPNKNGELEVITKLNIPFGCLEIRLEAIATDTSTQLESHKFTIQRTVIPPDLPNIQYDAMLGM